jgi:hypothetical protein
MIRYLRGAWIPVDDGSTLWTLYSDELVKALKHDKPMDDDLDIELNTTGADFSYREGVFLNYREYESYMLSNKGHLSIIRPKLFVHINRTWTDMYVKNIQGDIFENEIDSKLKIQIKKFVIYHQEIQNNTCVSLNKYDSVNNTLTLTFHARGNARSIEFAADGDDPYVTFHIKFHKQKLNSE